MEFIIIFSLAFIIDLIIGEIDYPFHPVRLMGHFIIGYQKLFRREGQDKKTQVVLGAGLVVALIGVTGLIVLALNAIGGGISLIIKLYLMYSVMSIGSLKNESMKVYKPLVDGNLEEARKMVGYIVGRDTTKLNEEEIIKATVETIAENTSDGGLAPMFYLAIGGPVLAFIYKAINTMDSMVGYKSDKYINFGKIAARLDDVANFIPARLTALYMAFSATLMRLNGGKGLQIMKRDARKHKSPNAGYPESVIAGALGIELGGDSVYFGKVIKKTTIGDRTRNVRPEDIKVTNMVLYVSGILFWLTIVLIRLILL